MSPTKRKLALFAVMVGALSLSFSGQVEAVTPLLGQHLAVVFAATNDLAALLALNEVASGRRGGVLGWSWVALVLSGGTALGLNTWHAVKTGSLPWLAAVVAGAEPVVLAWVLSHVVALAAGSRESETAVSASEPASHEEPKTPAPAPEHAPPTAANNPASEAMTQPLPTVSGPAHPALASSSEQPEIEGKQTEREALPDSGQQSEPELPIQLIDRAERIERQELAKTNGKRGLAFREAPRRLGVRYDTARVALKAARARIASESESLSPSDDPAAA